MTLLICVQLTDGGELKRYAKDDPCKEPKQMRRAMFPRGPQAKRKLEGDDEFEEDKAGVG